jgi:hypothetical protein
MVPVGVVEVCGTFTGKLEVLLLIMANRYMSCSRERVSGQVDNDIGVIGVPVNENVGSLEDWV